MEVTFKNTALLSKEQVDSLLSKENVQNKIFALYYSQSDVLIDEASSLISNYVTCKHMVSIGVNSREYVKRLKSQSHIKTAIAYAETDEDYINIAKELIGFYGDIGTEFITDSICNICTTYRSYETIGNILYVLAEYGFIFNDSQLQRIQSSAYPHPRIDFLNHFYKYTKSETHRHHVDHNTEVKDES